MSETGNTKRSSTVVLGEEALDETKSLEELAELAGAAGAADGTGMASTIVLDDDALNDTKDLEELGELAVGIEDLDIEDALSLDDETDSDA